MRLCQRGEETIECDNIQPLAKPAELRGYQTIFFFQGGLDFHSDGKIEIVEEEAISAPVEGMRQHHSIACLFNVLQTLLVVYQ